MEVPERRNALARVKNDVRAVKQTIAKKAKFKKNKVASMVGKQRLRQRGKELGHAAEEEDTHHSVRHSANQKSMDKRLLKGRTPDTCLRLMNFHLLKPLTQNGFQDSVPQRGLSCKIYNKSWVFILDTFMRRGEPLADVATLQKQEDTGTYVLKDVRTVPQAVLREVGFHFRPLSNLKGIVHFAEVPQMAGHIVPELAEMLSNAVMIAAKHVSEPRHKLTQVQTEEKVMQVIPAAAEKHMQQYHGHVVAPRADKGHIKFLLDLPVPVPFQVQPYRCRTCATQGIRTEEENNASNYFPVTEQDMLESFQSLCPEVHVLQSERSGCLFLSPQCLFYLLTSWYEELNVRAVRRRLADLYSANLLSLSKNLPTPDSLVWGLSAVPHAGAIKEILFQFFNDFVAKRVQAMVDLQMLFNGQGLRFDGNYALARQVAQKTTSGRWTKPYTVAFAWCGADGSLLKPITLAKSESIPEITRDLAPWLQRMQEVRMNSGHSAEDCVPVFHSTDSYAKHRRKLASWYKKQFPAELIQTSHVACPH